MPVRGLNCTTDSSGLCEVKLGGGRYLIRALHKEGPLLYSEESRIELPEGKIRNIALTIHRDLLRARIAVPQEAAIIVFGLILPPLVGLAILLALHFCSRLAVMLLHSD